jgi:hypothetical protein
MTSCCLQRRGTTPRPIVRFRQRSALAPLKFLALSALQDGSVSNETYSGAFYCSFSICSIVRLPSSVVIHALARPAMVSSCVTKSIATQGLKMSFMAVPVRPGHRNLICRHPVHVGRQIEFHPLPSVKCCLDTSSPFSSIKEPKQDVQLIR